jgi:hypothetical protein
VFLIAVTLAFTGTVPAAALSLAGHGQIDAREAQRLPEARGAQCAEQADADVVQSCLRTLTGTIEFHEADSWPFSRGWARHEIGASLWIERGEVTASVSYTLRSRAEIGNLGGDCHSIRVIESEEHAVGTAATAATAANVVVRPDGSYTLNFMIPAVPMTGGHVFEELTAVGNCPPELGFPGRRVTENAPGTLSPARAVAVEGSGEPGAEMLKASHTGSLREPSGGSRSVAWNLTLEPLSLP